MPVIKDQITALRRHNAWSCLWSRRRPRWRRTAGARATPSNVPLEFVGTHSTRQKRAFAASAALHKYTGRARVCSAVAGIANGVKISW